MGQVTGAFRRAGANADLPEDLSPSEESGESLTSTSGAPFSSCVALGVLSCFFARQTEFGYFLAINITAMIWWGARELGFRCSARGLERS